MYKHASACTPIPFFADTYGDDGVLFATIPELRGVSNDQTCAAGPYPCLRGFPESSGAREAMTIVPRTHAFIGLATSPCQMKGTAANCSGGSPIPVNKRGRAASIELSVALESMRATCGAVRGDDQSRVCVAGAAPGWPAPSASGCEFANEANLPVSDTRMANRTAVIACAMVTSCAICAQHHQATGSASHQRAVGPDSLIFPVDSAAAQAGPDTTANPYQGLESTRSGNAEATKLLPATATAEPAKPATRSIPKALRKRSGQMETGLVHGAIPFVPQSQGLLNGYVKGRSAHEIGGVPLAVELDLGTDRPLRGQRNKLRIAFDPQRAALAHRWQEARDVHETKLVVDSLEKAQAAAHRRADGTAGRLAALLLEQARRAAADSVAEAPGADTTAVHGQRFLHPFALSTDEKNMVVANPRALHMARSERVDSLHRVLEDQRHELAEADAALARARQVHQQRIALSRLGAEKAPLANRLVQGLRRFEIGNCLPENGEFLLNGVNLQGASFTYGGRDIYLSLDHGRIFDDDQLNAEPVSDRLRRLQESLFLIDARDLNPRKISALAFGYGLPEGTHAHFGFLRGSRIDHPAGATGSGPAQEALINHVAEINLGLAVGSGQQLRLVYARSAVGAKADGPESGGQGGSAADLFNQVKPAADALTLAWQADFNRTATRLSVAGRYVASGFLSYGLGFLRSGTRSGEVRMDQRLWDRVRLRARAIAEERTVEGVNSERRMHLGRGQLALQAKPTRTLSLQLSYTPAFTAWVDASGPSNASHAIGGSVAVRERWHAAVLSAQASFSHVTWTSTADVGGTAFTPALSMQLMMGESWSVSSTWTAFVSENTDASRATSNFGGHAAWRAPWGWTIEAGGQLTQGDGPAWLAELRKELRKGLTLGARSQRFAEYPQVQGGDALGPVVADHAFTLFLRSQW